ncbi:vesicle transport protein USE1 [Galendromus occidentalis]|uniref:Vesicle transport protein USE1 n=1 Tax=Galendromus occidentalis TaxID=34638 RepID=A0AAJ6VUX6_9ACAR|nr:vesicle transport protein USE1 [Galendromus occidentalis]
MIQPIKEAPTVVRVTKSRTEMNLIRLLSRCEALVVEKKLSWKLEAYVEKLDELLNSLEKQNTIQPSLESINAYQRKINFIKGAMRVEKAEPEMKLVEQTKLNHYPDREVHQRQGTKVHRELRENLFGKEKKKQTQDVDQILREHESTKQKIAESMVSMAQDLKRNAQTAKHIIAKDTEVVKRTVHSTDENFGKLQKETERLEKKLKFSCSCHCTMWIMLVIACMVFLQMVMFMRFFPKRY